MKTKKHDWQLDVENDEAPRCHRCGDYLRGYHRFTGVLCGPCIEIANADAAKLLPPQITAKSLLEGGK